MTTDRDRRARLEQLQAELRDERALVVRDPTASLAALEAALTTAQAKAFAAQAREEALTTEHAELTARQAALTRELAEARVLALGASRRDRYIDWAPKDTVPDNGSRRGAQGSPLLLVGPAIFVGAVFLLSLCGR